VNLIPADKLLGNIFPFISLISMKPEELVLFFKTPRIFRNNRRKVIVPSLSALLS
jgi:hypothetical protein